MAGRIQFRPDRSSGPLLASAIVLFLGALGAAVVVTASGVSPLVGILIFVAFAAIVPALALLLRATPQRTLSSLYSWIRGQKQTDEIEYQPRATRSRQKYGTNRPPSADELKDLKGSTSNWVPSNVPQASRKKKSH